MEVLRKFARTARLGFASPRTLAVFAMSFSSGLPLGLVWIAIPDWLRSSGVDLRIVGLVTLAQAPWSFKLLWSPWMDLSLPFLGRRRGWILLSQIALGLLILGLGWTGHIAPEAGGETAWVLLSLVFAVAIASASHDIVVDAYAVDALRVEEQAVAVGGRTALYRLAMFFSGALTITLAGMVSWFAACALLALAYLPLAFLTLRAPEPEEQQPPRSFRDAVWLPFLGFLGRPRALQILAFVLLYKLCDNLSQALLRPFLVDMGYDAMARGVAFGTVGLAMTLTGTFLGGMLTPVWGLGRCLWIFGLLQIFSNLGYIVLTYSGVNVPLMLGALSFENLTTGLGMGAFGVLLLRITQKRFSATQYALFSSLFALPRILAGPVTGYLVFAFGWRWFFWLTIVSGIPGLILLQRILPWGRDEPRWQVLTSTISNGMAVTPPTRSFLILRGVLGGVVAAGVAVVCMAGMSWLSDIGTGANPDLSFAARLLNVLIPVDRLGALRPVAAVAVGCVGGLLTAATVAARAAQGEKR